MFAKRQYFAPVLIALCLACFNYQRVDAARIGVVDLVESGKVCQVATKDDSGQSIHRIGFSFDIPGGCKIGSCSFYNMPQLAENFIEKPVRTPPTGSIGNCRCLMKLPVDPDAQLQEDHGGYGATELGSDGGKTMLNFISHRGDPCTEYGCWLKYNHFAHLATRTSEEFNDDWTNGNHWKFSCTTGKATLQDLKTVKEVRDELPDDQQEEFSKLIEDAGILQALVEEDEPQVLHEEEAYLDDTGDEREEELSSSIEDKPPGINTFGGPGRPAQLNTFGGPEKPAEINTFGGPPSGSRGEKPPPGKRPARFGRGWANDAFDKLHPPPGRRTSDASSRPVEKEQRRIPEATANKLQKAIDLLMHVEVKLSKMLVEAEACKSDRMLGSEPAVRERIPGAWNFVGFTRKTQKRGAQEIESENACEALWLNMEVLVNLLKRNVDLGEAFLAASTLSDADAAALEAFLLEIDASMALQNSIVHSLENLLAGGREAAEELEDHILMQLGEVLKPAVQQSRGKLQHAFDAIMA